MPKEEWMKTHRYRTAVGAGLVALAMAALCGSAWAAEPKAVTNSVAVAADGVATTSATCPAKHEVSGLGYTTTTNSSQGTVLTSLVPTPRAVTVTAKQLSSNAGQLTGTAYCTKVAKKKKKKKKGAGKSASASAPKKGKKKKKRVAPKQFSATAALPTDGSGAAVVTCPPGRTVRSGGFSVALDGAGEPTALPSALELIAPNQWRVSADALGDSGSVTAIALCGKGRPVSSGQATVVYQDSFPHTATAVCPAGKTAAFGGYRETGETTAHYESGFVRSGSNAWAVTAFPFEPGEITAIAYCT
jgi:hypothetical protein